MGKRQSIFGERFKIFRDNNYRFYFTTLTGLTINMQTERRYITSYFSLMFLAYFILS